MFFIIYEKEYRKFSLLNNSRSFINSSNDANKLIEFCENNKIQWENSEFCHSCHNPKTNGHLVHMSKQPSHSIYYLYCNTNGCSVRCQELFGEHDLIEHGWFVDRGYKCSRCGYHVHLD